eukprot:269330_1
MSQPASEQPRAPPRKRYRQDPYVKRMQELETEKQRREQKKLQRELVVQQRIQRLRTLEELPLSDKRFPNFCNYLIDSGQPMTETIVVGSNSNTKFCIVAYKMYQMLKKMERITNEDPRNAIEFGVILNQLNGVEDETIAENKQDNEACVPSPDFRHYFAIFKVNYGHLNNYVDVDRVSKPLPKLLGVPLNELEYAIVYANPVIMSAQTLFVQLLQLNSALGSKELGKRFRKRRDKAADTKFKKCLSFVQQIVQKKEQEEMEKGMKPRSYIYRIVKSLSQDLQPKVLKTFAAQTDKQLKTLTKEHSQKLSRRLIIMSMHQMYARGMRRYHDNH